MKTVFLVQHTSKIFKDFEDIKIIGNYESYDAGLPAVERLRVQPGFSDCPDMCSDERDEGFAIEEYHLGKDEWIEGFARMYPDDE